MRILFRAVAVVLFLSGFARAQSEQDVAQPSVSAPSETPPPPPGEPPAPPTVVQSPENNAPQLPPPQDTSNGQWVFTSQYGWVWMPYAPQYVYAPPNPGDYPYAYVYYPTVGWAWLYSPWVWGWGPRPWFGLYGPRHYVWFGSPHFYGGWGFRPYRGWAAHGPGVYGGWGGYRGGGWGGGYRAGPGVGHGYHSSCPARHR